MTRPEKLSDLEQFTGTDHYYRHLGKFVYTDGVKYMAETAGAYWLLDVVFSHVADVYANKDIDAEQKEFLVCSLTVSDDDSALFTLDDGNDNILATQKIEYTDFPAQSVKFYIENNVALLPSEH